LHSEYRGLKDRRCFYSSAESNFLLCITVIGTHVAISELSSQDLDVVLHLHHTAYASLNGTSFFP